MKPATALSALKLQGVLGPEFQVLEFEASTRTSEEAAAAIGCTVAEIAKSLIFKAADGRSVLVIASGANRVDERKVRALLGQKIGRADADFVREATAMPSAACRPSATPPRPSR
jgi:prolyl-tRNA editing enzyme YbaK/EbsC (Cys-tRNA(Pro) deacylase)